MDMKKSYEKELFKISSEAHKSRLTGDRNAQSVSKNKSISSRAHSINQNNINRTPLIRKDYLQENNKQASERAMYNNGNGFYFGQNNGNNKLNNLNHYNNNNNMNQIVINNDYNGNSIFSKLGNDIMNKSPSPYKKQNKSPLKNLSNTTTLSKKKFNQSNNNNVENMIENLMDLTKEKSIHTNRNNLQNSLVLPQMKKSSPTVFESKDQENLQSIQNMAKESNIIVSDNVIAIHSVMWEALIDMQTHSDNKIILQTITRKLLQFISDEVLNQKLKFDLFNIQTLNHAYSKLSKLSFIMTIFLKFILLDFNYEMTIKTSLKKIIMGINEYLFTLIENELLINNDFQSPGCRDLSHEFMEKYMKGIKFHKIRKTKESSIQFGSTLSKNLEIVIANIKQFSNNFFKIGYFKPIHSICFEILRLLDSQSIEHIGSLIVDNVLFYLIHNTTIEKKQSQVATKQISFGQVGMPIFGMINVSPPFLPHVDDNIYTLVLDLDETLVHFFFTPSGGTFLIRPGAIHFLQDLSCLYEISIFTAAVKDYADSILDIIDPEKKYIKHRLYRHHTSIASFSFVKDLSKLGRDLSKVLIIDNSPDNFKLQVNNGLGIKTWNEDMKDTQLPDLGKVLRDLYQKRPSDIRPIIKKLKEEITRRTKKNIVNPYANIEISKYML